MFFTSTVLLFNSIFPFVSAHGHVRGIIADHIWYEGYDPGFQFRPYMPLVIGWSDPQELDNGFVAPDDYMDADIVCHIGAKPALVSAKVAAGSTVELQWTPWPDSHRGPVLDYLARCTGDCSSADKLELGFFKISEAGLVDATAPTTWASDQLIANNNSWTVIIPHDIAPGHYVLRHEIIALHSAMYPGGAQNYPQCINLEITGTGTAYPAGIHATEFYKSDDPGILFNLHTSLSTYIIPGPSIYSNAVSTYQTHLVATSYAAVSSGPLHPNLAAVDVSSTISEPHSTTRPASTTSPHSTIAPTYPTTLSTIPVKSSVSNSLSQMTKPPTPAWSSSSTQSSNYHDPPYRFPGSSPALHNHECEDEK